MSIYLFAILQSGYFQYVMSIQFQKVSDLSCCKNDCCVFSVERSELYKTKGGQNLV